MSIARAWARRYSKRPPTPVPQLKVPDVISMSYADAEFTLGADYVERCNVELSKLAARGVSVIAASGTPQFFFLPSPRRYWPGLACRTAADWPKMFAAGYISVMAY